MGHLKNLRCRISDAVRFAPSERSSSSIRRGIGLAVVMAVKALPVLSVACALAAFAGCGGNPLKTAHGGTAGAGNSGQSGSAGQVGSTGQAAGQSGTAGQGSAGQSGCNNAPCTPPAGPCDMLLDEKSCTVHPECKELSCPDCKGGQTFVSCTEPDGGLMVECGPCPPACLLLDESSCGANPSCQPLYCSDCSGQKNFTSCAPIGGGGVSCPASTCPIMPVPCSGLDEMACIARSDCHPGYCGCPGEETFTLCLGANEAVACGTYSCPNEPASCADVTTQGACDARTECHSVFGKCQNCPCPSAGCGVGFVSCADGAKADCSGPKGVGAAFCMVQPPDCASTTTTAYVVSYTADCYEGCVLPAECGP